MNTARTPFAASPLAIATALGTALIGQQAQAAGVAAGTVIQNTATATYTAGTTTASVNSNTVSVKVDELINVAVTGLTTTPAAASSAPAVLVYSVTNTGNGNEAFNITADPNVSGNAFNATISSVVIDSNGNGTYDPGVDTVIANGSAAPSLAPDASVKVFVLAALPGSATDGQTSNVKLTAASVTGTGAPGTLLAGKGDGGVDAVIGTSTAAQHAQDPLIASLAQVTLTKSATILDPFGGTTPVPGAVVTYSLVAHVAGSGTANNLHVTDSFPTGTTYQSGTITLNAAALTDAADTDAGTASASGIDVALGNIAGGSPDKTVTFKVKIN
ncbi:MAG: hypothetical protein JSS36_06910 [Proteobacteria bacterium]|nr:hypothetical protein [Pseudomonadota bacterium]